MVLLTPKFVFVAVLASLTAFSLAPPADAAAIAMRRSHQQHISDASEVPSSFSFNHTDHPVLPLPARLTSASGKQTQDRSETLSSGNVKRQSPRDFFASKRRALTPEDLPPLLTRRDPLYHQSHQPNELSPPLGTPPQQPTQEESGARPFVHIKGVNSHAIFDRRAPGPHPHPRHRHNRHHHHSNHHDHHHGSKHADDVVVIKGDNDNIHIGRRSPLPDHHHHHHHHHNDHHHWRSIGGKDMSSAKEDSDLGRRSPDPRHDHHHHHDHHGHGHHKGHSSDKVIIEGDDNNVSVHSRSRMVRHQRVSYIPDLQEGGVHHEVHARKYVPSHQVHHDSESADRKHSQSSHRADQDQSEKHPRSVLINSVEGEEKYLVPDDYQDQRVTMIEGDGISKVLAKAKRGDPGIEGVPGSIEIMSQSAKSEAGQRIASLVLVEPDSAMAEFGNNTFILNASESNHTQLYMVALNTTDSGVQGEDVPVALKIPVFNPESASMEGYCATYDPQPPAPAPLSAEPCFYDEPAGPHKSQVFAYTPSTSVIRPMWFSGETDEEDSPNDAASNSTVKSDAAVDPKTPLNSNLTSVTSFGDFGNSTVPPPSSTASFDNSTALDEGLSGSGPGNDSMVPNAVDFAARAQNVTLIFTPAAPVVPPGSKTPAEDLSDLDDETTMNSSNGTSTDTSASPSTSSASGRFNDTETDWAGSLADDGLTSVSMPLPQSGSSKAESPATVPTESSTSKDNKDLSVMVGVARHNDRSGGVVGQETNMRAVSTAPYHWKFDRERS